MGLAGAEEGAGCCAPSPPWGAEAAPLASGGGVAEPCCCGSGIGDAAICSSQKTYRGRSSSRTPYESAAVRLLFDGGLLVTSLTAALAALLHMFRLDTDLATLCHDGSLWFFQ